MPTARIVQLEIHRSRMCDCLSSGDWRVRTYRPLHKIVSAISTYYEESS